MAGEEISWGQRILGIETPESIAAVNTQQELTLHNHKAIIGYVYYSYLAIGLYCSTAWLLWGLTGGLNTKKGQKIPQWLDELRDFVPSWYWLGFFLPILLYVPLRESYGYIRFGHWEEMSEMFLAAGFLAHLWERKNERS